jgi:hypothetical protein
MALLAVVPILAVLGAFEPKDEQTKASGTTLELALRYPSLSRHKALEQIEIEITNLTAAAMPTVVVSLDRRFLGGFSKLAFLPEPQSAYRFEMRNVLPGETRQIAIELEAERVGRFKGDVAARNAQETVRANASTFILP